MNEGNITVVDVIATSDGYALSRPAQDLYIAYEVVRRHIDDNGVRHYAQMSSAKITEDGYEFVFETGDTFTCASHEDLPTSETLSDELAGGGSSGGGALIVNLDSSTGALDKTVEEINNALLTGPVIIGYNFTSALPGALLDTYHVLKVDMIKSQGYKVVALKLATGIGGLIGTYTPEAVTFSAAELTDYPELDT